MAYRHRLKPNGQFEPKCEDDEYSIHIHDIVRMAADYAKLHSEKTSKKVTKSLAYQLLALGVEVKPTLDTRPASRPTIGWSKRLPRTFADEGLDEAKMEISPVGTSKIVFTKTYHSDDRFDKYKRRIEFRNDRWYYPNALRCFNALELLAQTLMSI